MLIKEVAYAQQKLIKYQKDPLLADRYYSYLTKENIFTKKKYYQGITKLTKNIPLQYIIGNVSFYGYPIFVNKNTLIPRFETEQLVNHTLHYLNKYFNYPLNIIDLGTGSGCIAITLAKELPTSHLTALDISPKALYLAKKNSRYHHTNIKFLHQDFTKPLTKKYDVIISNPPYLSHTEKIDPLVSANEPAIALYAKNKGLIFYEQILQNISHNLNNNYLIALEIGYHQAIPLTKIIQTYLPTSHIIIKKDYAHKDRFIFISNLNFE